MASAWYVPVVRVLATAPFPRAMFLPLQAFRWEHPANPPHQRLNATSSGQFSRATFIESYLIFTMFIRTAAYQLLAVLFL